MNRLNYTRRCVRCLLRLPFAGFRLLAKGWHCPKCAAEVAGPPTCRFCGGVITPEQPRTRMSDRTIAHQECYFDAAVLEGV